jgi:uncharacterized protein YbjQ (UPF0145 family)
MFVTATFSCPAAYSNEEDLSLAYAEGESTMAEKPKNLVPRVPSEMTSTTFDLPGYRVAQSLGVVRGITVRSANLGNQILGGLRTLGGGEIPEFLDLAEQSRERAFQHLLEHAAELGANAVLGVRYDANEMTSNMNEVLAYGTAVVVEPVEEK